MKNVNLDAVRPYGDTLDDGKVQVSFTLPVENGEKAIKAAKELSEKMGLNEPEVVLSKALDNDFTFFVVYGSLVHSVNYNEIVVPRALEKPMSRKETEEFISKNFGRELTFIGASTGTDAHTVGIDAIMNMKGFHGHYGLERYKNIRALNLGSQVTNEDLVRIAREEKADVVLVSQTVTQKNVHIKNLEELIELMDIEDVRKDMLVIIGGPRISMELAKELGFDAGFGQGKYAEDVATFAVKELLRRKDSL